MRLAPSHSLEANEVCVGLSRRVCNDLWVWKSEDMGVYAGRSREGQQLLKDGCDGCGLVRAFESEGERRAWEK